MRLMNELHLYCPARRKHKHYCKYGDSAGTFEPNILQRQFSALQPLQKWTTDITEFKAFGKKLYLSVILDMYNGEIINYTLTESASLASVQQLISQAITILPQGTNLLFHSDRGWHYQQHLSPKRGGLNGNFAKEFLYPSIYPRTLFSKSTRSKIKIF